MAIMITVCMYMDIARTAGRQYLHLGKLSSGIASPVATAFMTDLAIR